MGGFARCPELTTVRRHDHSLDARSLSRLGLRVVIRMREPVPMGTYHLTVGCPVLTKTPISRGPSVLPPTLVFVYAIGISHIRRVEPPPE